MIANKRINISKWKSRNSQRVRKTKKKYKILVHCRELNCDHVAEKKINPLKLKKKKRKKEKNVISTQRKKNLAVNIKYEKILSF